MTTRPPLAEHQATGVDWIRNVRRGLLGDEPGLGKTRTAIEAFDGGKVLVVAPNLILESGTWADELQKWADHPEGFTLASYSMLNEREWTGSLKADGTPNLSATRPAKTVRPEFRGVWDAVIVDEAHYTKGRKTHWTAAVDKIARRAGALLEMTGTPISGWAPDLFPLLQALNPDEAKPGQRLGSFNRWVGQWFEVVNPTEGKPYYNPHAKVARDLKACYPECLERPAWDPCEHYARFVRDNLGERFLRRLRDDVLDLPPATETEVLVPMDAPTRRMYREMKKEMLTEYEGEEVMAWTSGAKNVLLDRITTSPWLLGSREGVPTGGKFDRLRYDLESRARPTLVLGHYQWTVEAAARVAQDVGARAGYVHGGRSDTDNGQAIRDFKAGRLDVLVGSLDTVSEGLTLTVADMCIFVEKSYKPSRNEQAMRRIHRMGQTRPVTILDYITPNSVDAGKRELLAVKTDRQMRMMTAAQMAQIA